MTDEPALYPMKDAPRDGLLFVWGAVGCQNSGDGLVYGFKAEFLDKHQPQDGFLPLPSDASSNAVAETAGKWLAVCDAEDVAAVIRESLRREDVRLLLADDELDLWVLETLKPAQEPTND